MTCTCDGSGWCPLCGQPPREQPRPGTEATLGGFDVPPTLLPALMRESVLPGPTFYVPVPVNTNVTVRVCC